MAEEYISLKPSEAYHGGGMLPEGDYDIIDAKFAPWDYNGTVAVAVPALGIEFKNADQSYVQWYSAGDMKNMRPSEDGLRLVKVGTATSLNDGTNCFQFLTALVRAGFSEDKLANDISVIIGMRVQIVHEATKARDFTGAKAASTKPGILAVIGKIHSMPGEKSKGAAKGAASTAKGGKANGAEANAAAFAPKATEALVASLKEAEGRELAKKALSAAVFRRVQNDPQRAEILNLLIQDSFLSGLGDVGVLFDADKGLVLYVGG